MNISKLLSVVLLFSLSSGVLRAEPRNLVRNADFQEWVSSGSGEIPKGWHVWTPKERRSLIATSRANHQGKTAFVVNSPNGSFAVFTGSRLPEPGGYTFSITAVADKRCPVALNIRLPEEGEENWEAKRSTEVSAVLEPNVVKTISIPIVNSRPGQTLMAYLKVRSDAKITIVNARLSGEVSGGGNPSK